MVKRTESVREGMNMHSEIGGTENAGLGFVNERPAGLQ